MRGLVPFLGHRLFRALIALWLVSTVVFVVMRLSGDPVPLLLPPDAPTSEIHRVRRELGLDRPLPVQYGVFLANILRGDFGRSIHFREPAMSVVRGYLAATLELGLTAFVLAAAVAVPVGLLSAMRRNSVIDHAAMAVALVGQSAPTFFLGILFILLLALKADLFPTSGRGDWRNLVLPALTLGFAVMAPLTRMVRATILFSMSWPMTGMYSLSLSRMYAPVRLRRISLNVSQIAIAFTITNVLTGMLPAPPDPVEQRRRAPLADDRELHQVGHAVSGQRLRQRAGVLYAAADADLTDDILKAYDDQTKKATK